MVESAIEDQPKTDIQQQIKHQGLLYAFTIKETGIVLDGNPFKRHRKSIKFNVDYREVGTVKFENDEAVKEFGRRMKEARGLTRLTQEFAAKKLGYKNSSKLNKIELGTDTRAVPLRIILKAAKLYDVTSDFLLGLADDWERDPVVCEQRQIGSWLLEHFEQLKIAELRALRELHRRQALIFKSITSFLTSSKENLDYAKRVQEINPEYDDLRGGNKLLYMLAKTAEDAMGLSYELDKLRALNEVAKKENMSLDLFEDIDNGN